MALNKYFNLYQTNSNEHTLVRDFFAEAVQIYGQDVYYVIRNIEVEDYLFREDTLSTFDDAYLIEMYMENYENFEGNDIISKIGYSIQDQMLFSVSVDRFVLETGLDMPNEGDLIYLPIANALFEIKFVEDEQQFYPNGTLPSFKIQCELFRYDNQDMNTGVPEIDSLDVERDLSEGGTNPFGDLEDDFTTEADAITDKDPDNPFGNY